MHIVRTVRDSVQLTLAMLVTISTLFSTPSIQSAPIPARLPSSAASRKLISASAAWLTNSCRPCAVVDGPKYTETKGWYEASNGSAFLRLSPGFLPVVVGALTKSFNASNRATGSGQGGIPFNALSSFSSCLRQKMCSGSESNQQRATAGSYHSLANLAWVNRSFSSLLPPIRRVEGSGVPQERFFPR